MTGSKKQKKKNIVSLFAEGAMEIREPYVWTRGLYLGENDGFAIVGSAVAYRADNVLYIDGKKAEVLEPVYAMLDENGVLRLKKQKR